jgi:hypothetical protein
MSEPRPLAASIGIVHESTWCRPLGYGIESIRLNPFMTSANPVSYYSYKVCDYSANNDADDGIDERFDLNKNTSVGKDDVAISCPVFHAMMECIQANQRHAITVLRHDVEHRNIVNLLKILEDAQCPDYMLQSILQWAYNAHCSSDSKVGEANSGSCYQEELNQQIAQEKNERLSQFLCTLMALPLPARGTLIFVLCHSRSLFTEKVRRDDQRTSCRESYTEVAINTCPLVHVYYGFQSIQSAAFFPFFGSSTDWGWIHQSTDMSSQDSV